MSKSPLTCAAVSLLVVVAFLCAISFVESPKPRERGEPATTATTALADWMEAGEHRRAMIRQTGINNRFWQTELSGWRGKRHFGLVSEPMLTRDASIMNALTHWERFAPEALGEKDAK